MLKRTAVISSFIAIFLLVYSPVIRGHFFFLDDYFWQGGLLTPDYFKTGSVFDGRFLTGLLVYQIHSRVDSVDGANIIRFIGVIGVGLFAYILYIYFRSNSLRMKDAFQISILICILPAMHVYVSWLNCIPYVLSVILAALASLLMFRAFFSQNSLKKKSTVSAYVITIILLLASLNIYQPTGMLYWSLAVVPLVMLKSQDFRPKWYKPYFIYFSAGCIAMALYFILLKIVHVAINLETMDRSTLIGLADISGKLKWFFSEPLYYSLNLWNVHNSFIVTALVSICIIAGIACEMFCRGNGNGVWSYRNYSRKYTLIIITVILSYSPNLLIADNSAPYRTIVALSAAICILLYLSLVKIGDLFKSHSGFSINSSSRVIAMLLLVLTVMSAYLSYNNVNKYFAKLQSAELMYVENVIQGFSDSELSEASRIYAISPEHYSVDGMRHEFGKPSSHASWARTAMIKVALRELGITRSIEVTHVDALSDIPANNDAPVVDFRKLKGVFDIILD